MNNLLMFEILMLFKWVPSFKWHGGTKPIACKMKKDFHSSKDQNNTFTMWLKILQGNWINVFSFLLNLSIFTKHATK